MKKKVFYIADWFNNIQKNLLNHLGPQLDITIILADKFPNYAKGNYTVKQFKTKDVLNPFGITHTIHESFLIYEKELFDYMRKENPDLVICNLWYKFSTIQIARYCRENSIPFILQTEMQRYPKSVFAKLYVWIGLRLFRNTVFDTAKYILPWTIGSKDFFIQQSIIHKKDKIQLMPACIDTTVFNRKLVKKKYPYRYALLL
ncbi:MAG: hypothetical protein C0412_19750, partial [Flavobacterium sp.]|nr:hypothetical protein [Flavobacterium sp.]